MNCIPTENRPDEVRYWINRGHHYKKPPTVKDAALFGKKWRAWWQMLQPDWRDSSWPPVQITESDANEKPWRVLDCRGCNGIFMVILSLSWWMLAVASNSEEDVKTVEMTIKDTKWVLDAMNHGHKHSLKDTQPTSSKRCKHFWSHHPFAFVHFSP